jgi:DNA gyrase subunit B
MDYSYHTLATRMKHAAYLTPGVTFTIIDKRTSTLKEERFYYE